MKFLWLEGSLAFVIAALFIEKNTSKEFNYSCADHMVDTYNNRLDDGYYDIALNASYSDSITVYCHFNYSTQYAWTLVESFSLTYASYPRYYAFYESYAYYEDYVSSYRNSRYRLSLTWMHSIFESMFSRNETGHKNPRKMMSTCNFDTTLERDYLIINLDDQNLQYNPLYEYWSGYTCLRMESINIRGYSCEGEDIYAYNSGSHFFVDSDSYSCDCEPWADSAAYSEDNFGYYIYSDTSFSCTASSTSTTNWWLGRYVPRSVSLKIVDQFEYPGFISFSNITAKDISTAYKYSENIVLDDCLNECTWDYYYNNNNNTCRYFIYLDSHKGDNDVKCFFFTKDNWNTFGDIGEYGDDNEIVFAVDFDLVGYSYPSDWIDKYHDNCGDYEEHDWCIDEEAKQSYDIFYNLRDRNEYNKTAIDVCVECGGGISEYNETNMSAVIGLPVYSYLETFADGIYDDLLCYLDFNTIENYYNQSGNNNSSELMFSNFQIESFDKVNLYSICYQYFKKLKNFYKNSEKKELKLLTKLVNCDVFSLGKSESISKVNISLCEFSSVAKYDNYNNYTNYSDINDHIDFIFAIGYNSNISISSSLYNVYLSSLWVEFESFILLSNDYDTIYSNVDYYDCERDIFESTNHEYSALIMPCNIKNQRNYNDDNKRKDNDDVIIGVTIGFSIAGIILVVGCLFEYYKKKQRKLESQHANQARSRRVNSNGGLCTICQDDISSVSNPQPIITLGCNHVFHEQCWIDFKASIRNGARNATCPNCRRNVY